MPRMSYDGTDPVFIVENLKETQYVLSRLDVQLAAKLSARVKRAVELIAGEARLNTLALSEVTAGARGGPSTLAEAANDAASGISVKKARTGWKVRQDDAIGAIVEFAAQGKTPQGVALVDLLNRHFGSPGRFVWEAADRRKAEVLAQIQAEVDKTVAEANAKMGTVL